MSRTKLYTPRSTILSAHTFTPKWYVIDAESQIVGRLATQVATVLMGKHRPDYTPHVNSGDFVIVLNAEKIQFSGAKMAHDEHDNFSVKMTVKKYAKFTKFPGGYRTASPEDYINKGNPEFIIEAAVKRMLPKTKLARRMLERLRVYKGNEHPHQGQSPEPFPAHLMPAKNAAED